MTVELGAFVVPDASDPAARSRRCWRSSGAGSSSSASRTIRTSARFLDTFSLLAFLAARTERIRLFPDVANLPLRHPAMLAKAAASIDLLSGGRFELGLGAGAFWDAIEAFGGPRRSGPESVDALEEAIAILRACWAGERSVTFEGEHYRVARHALRARRPRTRSASGSAPTARG